jgi:hypothetical protein
MVRTLPPEGAPGVIRVPLALADAALLSWGEPLLLDPIAPLRTVNGYGLFRAMTTTRPEIVVEGSADGATWREYSFRWKPGDLARAPGFVSPHMPRLDWQMWFAALSPQRQSHWLVPLADALLAGNPRVLALLGENPFPEGPPRRVRYSLYDYRFTTPEERAATGAWWARERLGTLGEWDPGRR